MAGNKASGQQDKDILLAAFETARAWSSLLVTLAIGAIVFTAIFRENFAPPGQVQWPTGLFLSWIFLGLAAGTGAVFLGNLVALLSKGEVERLNLYDVVTRSLAIVQWVCFGIGTIFLVAFFAKNLF